MIWLDDARARQALALQHDTAANVALLGGATKHSLPEHEDPADQFEDATSAPVARAADPQERAAQIQAFLLAAGGEAG